MSTARFRQHFQRKLLPILRIDREFSERRRNSFLFSRPWGRWWGRIGGFFVPTCANSCSLLLTRAIPPNRWKQRKSPGTSTKFRDYLWSSGGTCRTRPDSRSPFVGGHGSVRSAHFRSYTSRTRKPRVNVVKSLDSRSNKSAPHGAHAGRRSLRSRLSEMGTGREGPYRGDVPRRHQDGSHLMQVVGNDATTL